MATDLAEFLGGAIGLSLLFQMPLLAGMVVTAVVTYGILMFEGSGFRPIELIIGSLVGIIGLCYLIEMFIAPVDWGAAACIRCAAAGRCRGAAARRRHHRRDRDAARHLSAFRPDAGAHAGAQRHRAAQGVALLQPRSHHCADRRRPGQYGDGDDGVGRFPRRASATSPRSKPPITRWRRCWASAQRACSCVSLIASGISSSAVGTMAGQMIMQGFVGFRIPIWLRRLVTMVPAFIVVALGVECDECAGHQPGGAQHRPAAADDRAADVHATRRHHGSVRQ